MLVFVLSFVFFLLFAAALSLSLIIKRKPIKGEDEALRDILKDLKCATCQSACAYAGGNENHASNSCEATAQAIRHKRV